MTSHPETVLEVTDLGMDYRVGRGPFGDGPTVSAVDGVSFTLARSETLALVGESGSGKTTIGKCILRLVEPTRGSISLLGRDITHLGRQELRPLRRHMHTVFQDPYSSLNPRWRVVDIVAGPLLYHGIVPRSGARRRALDMLDRVGIRQEVAERHPHGLSGGQRQRVAIARALVLKPALVVADEPISALDASVQAAVLNLLMDLREEMGFACLFITHDLSAAKLLGDRVAVMYAGKFVEYADGTAMFRRPRHPYSQALLSGALIPDPEAQRNRRRIVLAGEPPSPLSPPSGCRFHPRCPVAIERCVVEEPLLSARTSDIDQVACHLVGPNGTGPVLTATIGAIH